MKPIAVMSSSLKSLLLHSKRHIKTISRSNDSVCSIWRHYAKMPNDSSSKQVAVYGADNLARFRVRRARPFDVPKVLRFVRENASNAWPGLVYPSPAQNTNLLIADFVSRTLCQGHSMVAEQQDSTRGWAHIRGLALNTSVCPWDAILLEKWAQCVKCAQFRQLMLFTAHCLRAPGLHDKHHVHNILQIILMVPPHTPKAKDITHLLAKTSIQRGHDVGFEVLRFDVTSNIVNNVLTDLKLKKEWESDYEILKNPMSMNLYNKQTKSKEKDNNNTRKHNISVYCISSKKNRTKQK